MRLDEIKAPGACQATGVGRYRSRAATWRGCELTLPAKSCPWDLVHIAAVREAIPRRNDSCATTPVVDHCLSRLAIDANSLDKPVFWPPPITMPTE